MKITKEWLKKYKFQSETIEWFEKQNFSDHRDVVLNFPDVRGRLRLTSFLLSRLMNKRQKIQFKLFSANSLLYVFEEVWPRDTRLKLKIKNWESWIKNPTKENNEKIRISDKVQFITQWSGTAYDLDLVTRKILIYGLKLIKEKK